MTDNNSIDDLDNNSRNIQIYDNSDLFWRKMWSKIDRAEESIFFLTYCMDNQFIANYTLIKLIKALERKVPVVLMIEHLNYYPNNKLLQDFENKGGIVIKPNKLENITDHIINGRTKKFFNRCHQKLYLVDKNLFIGSANLANEYSDYKFGKFAFYDLNLYIKNTIAYNKILALFQRLLIENFEDLDRFNKIKKDLEEQKKQEDNKEEKIREKQDTKDEEKQEKQGEKEVNKKQDEDKKKLLEIFEKENDWLNLVRS